MLSFLSVHNVVLICTILLGLDNGKRVLIKQKRPGGKIAPPGLWPFLLKSLLISFFASQIYFDFLHPWSFPNAACFMGFHGIPCAYVSAFTFTAAYTSAVWVGWYQAKWQGVSGSG